jgi:hypothetical protein
MVGGCRFDTASSHTCTVHCTRAGIWCTSVLETSMEYVQDKVVYNFLFYSIISPRSTPTVGYPTSRSNTPALHPGGPEFISETRYADRISSLSPCKQIRRWYLKLAHDRFLANASQSFIYLPTIRRYRVQPIAASESNTTRI